MIWFVLYVYEATHPAWIL